MVYYALNLPRARARRLWPSIFNVPYFLVLYLAVALAVFVTRRAEYGPPADCLCTNSCTQPLNLTLPLKPACISLNQRVSPLSNGYFFDGHSSSEVFGKAAFEFFTPDSDDPKPNISAYSMPLITPATLAGVSKIVGSEQGERLLHLKETPFARVELIPGTPHSLEFQGATSYGADSKFGPPRRLFFNLLDGKDDWIIARELPL
jgi:hypothetical protein